MRPWLVLPVKSLADGKSRLAPHLLAAARRELNVELLARSLSLAARYPGIDRTVVVSRCHEVLETAREHGARPLLEDGCGLNEAVAQAVAWLRDFTSHEILVASCDLPYACEVDLRGLVERSRAMRGGVVLATDRVAEGTNALCLPPGASFRFAFGPSSRQRHVEESARRALPCCVLRGTSLAFDIDAVDDYREWRKRDRRVAAGDAYHA